jgi:hypothetical protein
MRTMMLQSHKDPNDVVGATRHESPLPVWGLCKNHVDINNRRICCAPL